MYGLQRLGMDRHRLSKGYRYQPHPNSVNQFESLQIHMALGKLFHLGTQCLQDK